LFGEAEIMVKRKTSEIWNFFKISDQFDSTGEIICSKEGCEFKHIIHEEKRKNSITTTPLWNHLKTDHEDMYKNKAC